MEFKTALVTGANGFVGRALVAALKASGVAVTCLIRDGAVAPDGVTAVRIGSLRPQDLIHAASEIASVDVIFHLAAYGVHPEQRDIAEMFAVNVAGTVAVVEFAKAVGARAVIYSGSCFEYADAIGPTLIQEDAPLTTSALYGSSKAAGGMFAQAVAKEAGISFLWIRLFGIYGPGEGISRIIPYLVSRLRNGERVDLTPGLQMRDMLFIDDAATGLIAAAKVALEGMVGPMNLCTGEPISIRALAEEVALTMEAPLDLLDFGARPYRPSESMWLVGDGQLFQTAAQWRPRIDWRKGVRLTVESIECRKNNQPLS